MSKITINIANSVMISSSADVEDMTSYVLLEQEDWFEAEIKFIRLIVTATTKAYDIGANHGVYAFSIAAHLQDGGHVWAFEPTRKPLEMLEASLADNPFRDKVTIVPCALSDHAGGARMGFSAKSETNSLQYAPDSETEEVRLDTLDAVWRRHGCPMIDIVKLDAEGEEENILTGGQEFFAACSPLVMFEIKSSSTHNIRLAERFKAIGYDLYRLAPGLNALVPFTIGDALDAFQLNLFACKPDRTEQLEAQGRLVPSAAIVNTTRRLPDTRSLLTAYPYAAAFSSGWGREDDALSLFLAAQDEERSITERWSLLRGSVAAFNKAITRDNHCAIQIGRIRALRCAGYNMSALTALQSMPKVTADHLGAQPFMPGLSVWDDRPVLGSPDQWVAAMMAELWTACFHFSTYFDSTALQWLWPERENPNLTMRMRRSIALILLRGKRADRIPFPTAPLLRNSPEHANAAVWSRLLTR